MPKPSTSARQTVKRLALVSDAGASVQLLPIFSYERDRSLVKVYLLYAFLTLCQDEREEGVEKQDQN